MAANTFRPVPQPPSAPRKNNCVGSVWLMNLRTDVAPPQIPMDAFPSTPVAGVAVPSFRLRRGLQDPTPPATVSGLYLPPGKYTATAVVGFDGSNLTDTQRTIDLAYNIVLAPNVVLPGAVRYTDIAGGVAPGSGLLSSYVYFVLSEETRITLSVEFTGTTQIALDGSPSTPGADFAGYVELNAQTSILLNRIG